MSAMAFAFTLDDHRLLAKVNVSGGYAGDAHEPASGPDVEVDCGKVMTGNPARPYFNRHLIYMVVGKRLRLLLAEMAANLETWLLENCADEIAAKAGEEIASNRAAAAEARWDALRDR